MKNLLRGFLSLIFLFSFSYQLKSQFRVDLSTNNYYDDNIYNNYYKVEDFVNGFTLGSGYDLGNDENNFQIYYIGNYNYYQKNILKTNYTHKIGLVNTTLFSENGNPMNAGINIIFRNNRDIFKIYDFRQLSLYLNYNHSINEGDNLLIGYFLSRNDYYNLSAFSYYENKLFARTSFSFETETSLMLGTELNMKNYVERYDDPLMTDGNSQLNVYANAAQSLSDYTGIAFHILGRLSLTDGTRAISDDTFIYYEEEILNSLYSNEGFDFGLTLTQLIGSNISLGFEFMYKTRNFTTLPAADVEGNSLAFLRKDKEFNIGVGLEYNLSSLINGLNLTLNYNFIKNDSNDFYYNFDNQLFLVGFDWSY